MSIKQTIKFKEENLEKMFVEDAPQQVGLNLPKLKKVNPSKSKLELPKLKRV